MNSHPYAPSVSSLSRASLTRSAERGVGLIEVVVVMVILLILGSVALVSGRSTTQSANKKSAVATARAYSDAITSFTADHGERAPIIGSADWPATIDGVTLDAPAFALGPVDVGSHERRYLAAVPEAVLGGGVLLAGNGIPEDNLAPSLTRIAYVHVDDIQWRIDVEYRDKVAADATWKSHCSIGDSIPAGVQRC